MILYVDSVFNCPLMFLSLSLFFYLLIFPTALSRTSRSILSASHRSDNIQVLHHGALILNPSPTLIPHNPGLYASDVRSSHLPTLE